MPRYVRSFTLDIATTNAVDKLMEEHMQHLVVLLPPEITPSNHPDIITDQFGLCPNDYEKLYAAAGISRDAKVAWRIKGKDFYHPIPELTWVDFQKHYRVAYHAVAPETPVNDAVVQLLIKELRRLNRSSARAQAHSHLDASKRPVSTSRVVDALINLGLETLKERVASLNVDAAGSKSQDAGKGQNKLSVTKRRKAVAV